MDILELLELTPEAEAMWQQLGDMALEDGMLHIAERCAAAVCRVARSRYLHKVNKVAEEESKTIGGDGMSHWSVRSRMAQLNKELKIAETILVDQGQVEEAMEMYQLLHRWEDSIAVAEASNHPNVQELRQSYYQWLIDSGQQETAAELKEKEQDYMSAINLYISANMPAKAANVVNTYNFRCGKDVLERIATALSTSGMDQKAGEFYEKMDMLDRALDCYIRGHAYRRAVELSRRAFPAQVVRLEESWGDWLVSQKQLDAAINHYIEAGVHVKAIEAAMNARQWTKAIQLVDTQDPDVARPYYKRIARHYHEAKNYDAAERFYVKAGVPQEAVEMYTSANRWEAAQNLMATYMSDSEASALYITQV